MSDVETLRHTLAVAKLVLSGWLPVAVAFMILTVAGFTAGSAIGLFDRD